MTIQALLEDLQDIMSEAVSSGKVEARKDFSTGYWQVFIGHESFVSKHDRMYKSKAAAVKVARQRAAKGNWYILPWNSSGRYEKADAAAGPIKNYEKADKELDKGGHDLNKVVIRWLKD